MLHDVALHDVTGGHQAYIHTEIYGASNFCSWLRPRAVHVMHAPLAFDEIINSLRENYTGRPCFILATTSVISTLNQPIQIAY